MNSVEQKTEEWLDLRSGMLTASMFEAVIGKTKSGSYTAARTVYMHDLAIERITGTHKDQITAKSLAHGNKYEPEACSMYEFEKMVIVDHAGFVQHPDYDYIGGSPDGLIGNDGGIEIKCPADKKIHLDTLKNGMPAKNKAQVQGLLWIFNRKYWDFVSYQPFFPKELQLYIQRIGRDEEYIHNLEMECIKFECELKKLVNELNQLIKEKK